MNPSAPPNHQIRPPQFAQQTQSRDLAFQVSCHSQQCHLFSHIVADLKMQNQGILGQRAVVTTALRRTLINIQTLQRKIAGLLAPTDHREPAIIAFNRSQIIHQAQREIAILSTELAALKEQITSLTEKSNEVLTRILTTMERQAQARDLAWRFQNMYTRLQGEIQQTAQVTRHFNQTDVATPATTSVAPLHTANRAEPLQTRVKATIERQRTGATASGPTAELQSKPQIPQGISKRTSPSDKRTLVSKLEDLLTQSQQEGYKRTYSPLMLTVKRVLETDDPVMLRTLGSSLIEELKEQDFLKKYSDEDVASYLVTGLKMKRIGIGLERNFYKSYEKLTEELRRFGSTDKQATRREKNLLRNKKISKKNSIILFLIGHNRLDLLPEELELMLIRSALKKGRKKVNYQYASPDDCGGHKKRAMTYLQPELTKDLKDLLALSQQEGYQPVISKFLQVVSRIANAGTTEEVEAASPLLEELICKLNLVTEKNMAPERLKLAAPALQKVKAYTRTNKEDFLQIYQNKIKQLEQFNNEYNKAPPLRDQKKLNLSARQVQYMIFQLLIAHDRLDLIPDDLYLPRLFLSLLINKEVQRERKKEQNSINNKRKASAIT